MNKDEIKKQQNKFRKKSKLKDMFNKTKVLS